MLHVLAQRPLTMALNAAKLTALTATYRDLFVVMDQMHKKDILGIVRPLVEAPPPAAAQQPGSSQAAAAAGEASSSGSGSKQAEAPVLNRTQVRA